jgi:hypothetical protein
LFCTRLTRAAKAGQKSIVLARQAQQTTQGRTPFICTLRVPVCLGFNSQQGPPSLASLTLVLFKGLYALYLLTSKESKPGTNCFAYCSGRNNYVVTYRNDPK